MRAFFERLTPTWGYLLVRVGLAAVFAYAGLAKLADPESFARIIMGYGLLPKALVPYAAVALPGFEVVLGAALALDVKGAVAASAALLGLFIAVLSYGIALGLDVDCGCFAPDDPVGQYYHSLHQAVARDVGLLAGCAYLYLCRWVRGVETARMPGGVKRLQLKEREG